MIAKFLTSEVKPFKLTSRSSTPKCLRFDEAFLEVYFDWALFLTPSLLICAISSCLLAVAEVATGCI